MSYQKPKILIDLDCIEKNVSLSGDQESWNYPIHGLFVTMKVRTEAAADSAAAGGPRLVEGGGTSQSHQETPEDHSSYNFPRNNL